MDELSTTPFPNVAATAEAPDDERLMLLTEAALTLINSTGEPAAEEKVLPAILDLARRLIAADACAVWRFVAAENQWRVVAASGLSQAYQSRFTAPAAGRDGQPFPLPDQPMVLEDVEGAALLEDRRAGYHEEGIRSLLVCPLSIQQKNSGTITFYYRAPRRFSETEIRLGAALTHIAGSALTTVDLYAEQRRMRDAAEAAHQRTSEILESISDAFYAVDDQERFTYINRRAEQMWGMRKEDLLGRNLWEAFPQSIGTRLEEEMRRAAREQQSVDLETFSIPLDRWIAVSIYPSRNALSVYFRDITARKRTEEALHESETRRRDALRDVLFSVTEGKLRLCESRADLPDPAPVLFDTVTITREKLAQLRRRVRQGAEQMNFPPERWQYLLTAVGEASMNAVVHGGGNAAGRIFLDDQKGLIQVWIEDQGKGIAAPTLHRATLERGFTTAGTMGHGFWMTLQSADRIYLLTGASGTTVVLEQERDEPLPAWMQDVAKPKKDRKKALV